MNVYSIFDKKVSAYGQPFFAVNDQAAIRMVTTATMERNSLMRCFPEDYSLERLGSFDEQKGHLEPVKPLSVCPVASIVWLGDDSEGGDSSPEDTKESEINGSALSSS